MVEVVMLALDTYQMWIFQLVENRNIIELYVEVLINALECSTY